MPKEPTGLRTRLAQAFSKAATAKGVRLGRLRFALADAALDVFDDEVHEAMVADLMERTRLRSMDFRGGMEMDIDAARELTAAWVAAARAMLGDAENYSETRVSFDVKIAESPEWYSLVVQRVGKLTPHEARRIAEAERDQLRVELDAACAVIRRLEAMNLRVDGRRRYVTDVDLLGALYGEDVAEVAGAFAEAVPGLLEGLRDRLRAGSGEEAGGDD